MQIVEIPKDSQKEEILTDRKIQKVSRKKNRFLHMITNKNKFLQINSQ